MLMCYKNSTKIAINFISILLQSFGSTLKSLISLSLIIPKN